MTIHEIQWTTQSSGLPLLGILQLLPLLAAMTFLAVRRDGPVIVMGILVGIAELLLAVLLYLSLDRGNAAMQLSEHWTLIPPINYHAAVDGISVLFILLTALLSLLMVVYGPVRRLKPASVFLACVFAMEAALMSIFMTMDLLWFTAMSAAEFWLAGELMKRWTTSAGRDLALTRFYQFMGASLMLLLAGTLVLGWNHTQSGAGWTFDLAELTKVPLDPALPSLVFFLLFYALAIRTPLFPLHGWLPIVAEHGNVAVAPSFLLGLKVGVYGLVRFVFPIVPDAVTRWSGFVVAFAATGIFYAALLALMQVSLRRLLAFAVVSHTSVLIIGLFSLSGEAFQGGIMLSVNFGLAIAGLLFVTGLIYRRTQTTVLSKLGGLFDTLPLFGVTFLIAGLSIVGMPGTPGFDAAHLMLAAAIERFGAFVTIAAALGNVAAAGFLLWAFQRAFLAPRTQDSLTQIAPATWDERAIAGAIIVVLLGAGFYTEPWIELIDAPSQQLAALFRQE